MGPNKGQFWTIPEEFESCFVNGVYRNIKKTVDKNERKPKKAKSELQETRDDNQNSSSNHQYVNANNTNNTRSTTSRSVGAKQQSVNHNHYNYSQHNYPQPVTIPQQNLVQQNISQQNLSKYNATVPQYSIPPQSIATQFSTPQHIYMNQHIPTQFDHHNLAQRIPPTVSTPYIWTTQNAHQSSSASVLTSQDERQSSDTTIMSDELDVTNEISQYNKSSFAKKESPVNDNTNYGYQKTIDNSQTHQNINNNTDQTEEEKSDYQKVLNWLAQMPDFEELSLQLENTPREAVGKEKMETSEKMEWVSTQEKQS